MQHKPQQQSWSRKFANAFAGVFKGIRGQSSFYVHIPCAIAVITAAIVFNLDATQWCLLVLCIGTVIAAELFNSCIESLAVAITQDHDTNIGDALDIASGAVLTTSIAAIAVGTLVFTSRICGWW